MKKDHLLIKGDFDYADEFGCECFYVVTKKEWKSYCEGVRKGFEKNDGTIEICFGTNEYLEVDSYEDWMRNLEEVPITKAEAEFLVKSFGSSYHKVGTLTWGTGDRIFSIGDYLDYDEEES